MSGPGCTRAREQVPELALGVLEGADRAEVLAHLETCATCRSYAQELSAIGDNLARLVPEVEPPPGFGASVLTGVGRQRARRRAQRRRRLVALVAASAAAASILSVAVVRLVDSDRPPVVATALRSTSVVGADGRQVGRLTLAPGNPPTAAVSVDYAVPDGSYRLMWRGSTGAAHRIGSIAVADGRGDWSGDLGGPAGEVGDGRGPGWLGLVAADGTVVCEAVLD